MKRNNSHQTDDVSDDDGESSELSYLRSILTDIFSLFFSITVVFSVTVTFFINCFKSL